MSDPTDEEVAALARGLSKAQREAVRRSRKYFAMRDLGDASVFYVVPAYRDGGKLHDALDDLGLVSFSARVGPKLSPLGERVRTYLETEHE